MEKLRKLTIVATLRGLIRKMKSGDMNPTLAWRSILIIGAITLVVVSIGAYITHSWAEDTSQVTTPSSKNRDTFSSDDIHNIVQVYTTKEATYQSLHQYRPTAPNPKDTLVSTTGTTTASSTAAQ